MSEIEPFPRAVLAHHYPETPCHGDFTTIKAGEYRPIEVLVGGTPCQSFSIAGLRGGMADGRGNLALEYLRLADRLRPRWVVWENVPGVLSSAGGRDFGAFLGGLGECGYGWSYRVLDAQYFGLAQRRKRVFVVGYLGDWRRAAAVLFEPTSLQGHPSPRRTAREGTSSPVADSLNSSVGRGTGGAHETDFLNVANPLGANRNGGFRGDLDNDTYVARCLNAHPNRSDGESETFVTQLYSIMPQNSGKDYKARPVEVAQPVMAAGPGAGDQGGDVLVTHSLRADGFDGSEDGTGRGTPLVAHALPPSAVRRLTPRECERLMGFPDDYTLIPVRGKAAADGPRYRALGNSMAVPVMSWIGQRIQKATT